MRPHGMRNSSQILHGNQTILGEKIAGRPHHLPWPYIFVTGMLTRDLFAAANLLVTSALAGMQGECSELVRCGRCVNAR